MNDPKNYIEFDHELSNSQGSNPQLIEKSQKNPYIKSNLQKKIKQDLNEKNQFPQSSKFLNSLRVISLAMGGYYFGYNMAIFNPLGEPIAERVYSLSGPKKIDLIGNINMYFTISAAFSVLFSGQISKKLGRIKLLIICEIFAFLSFLAYSIKSTKILLLTRIIAGFLTGIKSSIIPITLTEMFPPGLAGFGGLFLYFSISSSILIGWLANPLCGEGEERAVCLSKNWKYWLASPSLVSILNLVMMLLLFRCGTVESPLYSKENFQGEKLEFELRKWYSVVYKSQVVEKAVSHELRKDRIKEADVKELFSKKLKFRFMVVCILNISQQLSGINFLIFYSTSLFDSISGNGSFMTLLIGGANVLGAVIGMYTIEAFGRRYNMIIGCLMQGLSFSLLGLGIMIGSEILPAITAVVFTCSFAVGLGGTMPLYSAEILPSVGVGIGFTLQWIFAAIIGKLIPGLLLNFGPLKMILSFIVFNILSFFFIDFACPETKGLDKTHIDVLFSQNKEKGNF